MKQLQKLDQRLITILLIVGVQMMGTSIMIPILPLYAQREFALDERMISVLISAFFAAQFVAQPWVAIKIRSVRTCSDLDCQPNRHGYFLCYVRFRPIGANIVCGTHT